MSLVVKIGKAGKAVLRRALPQPEPHLCYTRRIERICTKKRICAMTFDDGPMNLPASPDRFSGRALTEVLLDTLAQYGAKGTFDVVGDTSENYPDQAGKNGSPAWGGIKYDHYPDIQQDGQGGALHNKRLIRRMLDEGHQITNHGYRHIIFGKKPFVYGKRVFLGSYEAAQADLKRLHGLLSEGYGYEMTMGRPPHYVDKVELGLSAYDIYAALGYQYLAASFDGGGWLPSVNQNPEAALEAEVRAMVEPMRSALEKDPDFFCGQIIFQKDGYNMARRTPVAYGLGQQLELLQQYGYRVVTVAELMAESPFSDLGREDADFEKLKELQKIRAVVYSDNRLHLDRHMSIGELAMLLCPRDEALSRRMAAIRSGEKLGPYSGALAWCAEQKLLPDLTEAGKAGWNAPITALPEAYFEATSDFTRRSVYRAARLDRLK